MNKFSVLLLAIASALSASQLSAVADDKAPQGSGTSQSGAAAMQEIKKTAIIDLIVSQSRALNLKNKLAKTSVSDPAIAEPVLVSEHEVVLLGKKEGTTTLFLWDTEGNEVGATLRVRSNSGSPVHAIGGALHGLIQPGQTKLESVHAGTIELEEYKPAEIIDLVVSQSRVFKMSNRMQKTSISDPSIAEPVLVSEHEVNLLGKKEGTTTLFIWDEKGSVTGIVLRVHAQHK